MHNYEVEGTGNMAFDTFTCGNQLSVMYLYPIIKCSSKDLIKRWCKCQKVSTWS